MVQEFDPLDPQQGDRPAEAAGSLLDLPLGRDAPPSAEPPPPPPPAWQPRRQRRAGWAGRLLLGALLLAAVVAAVLWLWPRGAPARLVSSAELVEFGPRRIGVPAEPIELRLANGGERLLRLRAVEIAGESAGRYGLALDECSGLRLVAGQECRLAIDYRPEVAGEHAAVLRVRARAANSPLEIPIAGRGVAPRIRLEPASVRFDALPVGGRGGGAVVRLTNEGDAALELHGLSLEGGAAADFGLEADRCSNRRVAAGESCSVRLVFAPRAEGARRALLRVRSDALAGGDEVTIEGEGLPAPEVALVPGRLDFGDQLVDTQGRGQEVVLRNRGSATLGLGAVRLEGDEFRLVGDDCSRRSLAAGGECRLEVAFRPGSEGAVRRRLEVTQAGGTGLQWSAELAGRGVAPRLDWSSRRLDWGEVPVRGEAEAKTLRLANGGSGVLRLDGVRLTGPDRGAFELRDNGCAGAALAPGSACAVAVVFRPERLAGYRAELEARGPSLRGPTGVELRGEAVGGRLAVEPQRLEFGSVRVSESTTRTLTLSNAGNAPLTLAGVAARGGAGAEFQAGGDCRPGAPLAPGADCRLAVRFAPAREGGRVAELVIRHDGEGGEAAVALSGAALPPPVGKLEVGERRLDFGSVRVGERSAIVALTLSNPGPGPVRLLGLAVDGPQASDFRLVPGSCEGIPFLAPGGVCGVGFRFQPSAAGPRRARLVVRHNAPGGPVSVQLEGGAYE